MRHHPSQGEFGGHAANSQKNGALAYEASVSSIVTSSVPPRFFTKRRDVASDTLAVVIMLTCVSGGSVSYWSFAHVKAERPQITRLSFTIHAL